MGEGDEEAFQRFIRGMAPEHLFTLMKGITLVWKLVCSIGERLDNVEKRLEALEKREAGGDG